MRRLECDTRTAQPAQAPSARERYGDSNRVKKRSDIAASITYGTEGTRPLARGRRRGALSYREVVGGAGSRLDCASGEPEYCGRIVAARTGQCLLLANDPAYRPPGDPELVFVAMMCSYATDIARGLLPGLFDDVDARRYARAALFPRSCSSARSYVDHTAAALGMPAQELRAAHDEHAGRIRRRLWR